MGAFGPLRLQCGTSAGRIIAEMPEKKTAAWISTTGLRSADVWLDPLSHDHAPGLAHAVRDGELWRLWFTSVPHPDDVGAFIDTALGERDAGRSYPFAVRRPDSGEVVGSTRYMNIDAANRRLEIGHTFYSKACQRTVINTACKMLLLEHAFVDLRAIAVEFRTHRLNRPSRAAIERLGARLDGILRNHMIYRDGIIRDTAVYSIVDSEWPAVAANLEFMLGAYPGPTRDGA